MLLQAFYSIRSERQLMGRLQYDLLFRWFVGMSCARMTVTPHVAQNTSGRSSAIDGRTTRHGGYGTRDG